MLETDKLIPARWSVQQIYLEVIKAFKPYENVCFCRKPNKF